MFFGLLFLCKMKGKRTWIGNPRLFLWVTYEGTVALSSTILFWVGFAKHWEDRLQFLVQHTFALIAVFGMITRYSTAHGGANTQDEERTLGSNSYSSTLALEKPDQTKQDTQPQSPCQSDSGTDSLPPLTTAPTVDSALSDCHSYVPAPLPVP
jgi:hypothetical protein